MIQGEAGTTVNFVGLTDLQGGSLEVHAGSIDVSGSLTSRGGMIELDAGATGTLLVSGSISVANTAAGQLGGHVDLLGSQVEIIARASIDASGDAGGGSILVGGDFHGANPLVRDAAYTVVGPQATIDANALSYGNGGSVVVWANDETQFYGEITARGGLLGGNGGAVEVSGEVGLTITGHVDLSAMHGRDGTLLLDPGSVTIEHENTGNTPPTATMNVFYDDWISGQLATGSLDISTASSTDNLTQNLIVDGTSDSGGAAVISWSTANTLSLNGAASISLDAGSSISSTGSGNLTLNGGTIALNGGIALTGGTLTLNTASTETQSTAFSTASLIASGGGVIGLSQANTISTGTTIDAGTTVQLGVAAARRFRRHRHRQ